MTELIFMFSLDLCCCFSLPRDLALIQERLADSFCVAARLDIETGALTAARPEVERIGKILQTINNEAFDPVLWRESVDSLAFNTTPLLRPLRPFAFHSFAAFFQTSGFQGSALSSCEPCAA
jgi:hypothetical protein